MILLTKLFRHPMPPAISEYIAELSYANGVKSSSPGLIAPAIYPG